MSRAQIRFEVNETIRIDHTLYRVAEHPALPGIPYVQRGARGFVIQLMAPKGERMALKYFKLKYRVPALVNITEALKQYAELPGLRAAKRTVFTGTSHPDLLGRYPALEYGVLMPWLPGMTWYDLVTTKTALLPRESLQMAQAASDTLANFEAYHLAHCDIAGANVMVERKSMQIEWVDIEEMYGPNLPQPVELPAGQDGYQHRNSRTQGQWTADGDRFGAAILLCEMLAWSDLRIRQNSADEHYFSATEMQDIDSPRYRLLSEVLRDQYGAPVVEALDQAWRSQHLADCPPLSTWRDTLTALQVDTSATQSPLPASPVVSGRRALDGVPTITNIPTGPERIRLEGIRLCRNCGAQNPTTEEFCKRCGFYIGTGARRPRQPVVVASPIPSAAAPVPVSAPVPPFVSPVSGTGPQPVSLQRDADEIIAARRMGGPGQESLRVVTPARPSDAQEGNFGSWIVLAIILGVLITILTLAMVAH